MSSRIHILWIFLMTFCVGFAQKKVGSRASQNEIYKGNESLKSNNFSEAEYHYRSALVKDSLNADALYNLGSAYYDREKYNQAAIKLFEAAKAGKTKAERHRSFHNLGNTFAKQKDYLNAAKAYRNALINDPLDEETRYNFTLAKKLLEKNPPKSDNEDKKNKDKNKDKSNKNKDNKNNKDKKKNDKDKKDKDNKKKDGKKKDGRDKQKPQKRKAKVSQQMARNILNAINKEEQKVQKKVAAKKMKNKGRPVNLEKDW